MAQDRRLGCRGRAAGEELDRDAFALVAFLGRAVGGGERGFDECLALVKVVVPRAAEAFSGT